MNMISFSNFKTWFKLAFVLTLLVGLVGCSSLNGAPSGMSAENIPDAVPKAEPRSKYGNAKSYVVRGKRYSVLSDAEAKNYDKVGKASWYGTKFHGRRTSTLDPYNMYDMTAASTVLPIPSYVKVTNLKNGRSAIVRVNDRGPFVPGSKRIIDLSYVAAKKLGYTAQGTTDVRVTAIDPSSFSSKTFLAKNEGTAKSTKSTELASNDSKLYLQVGAFHSRNSAESMRKKIAELTKLNHAQVAVKEGISSGSSIYRVQIGPLKDADKSQQVAQLLAENGFEKAVPLAG